MEIDFTRLTYKSENADKSIQTSVATTDFIKSKELNLCELLKDCEGEEFYDILTNNTTELSEILEDKIVLTIKIPQDLTFKIHNVMPFVLKPSGSRYYGGKCILWPSKELYEKYPLDPVKAWSIWASERKPKRWRAEYGETYYSLRNDFSVCEQNENNDSDNNLAWNQYNYFRTKEEAQQAADGVREWLEKFHEHTDM